MLMSWYLSSIQSGDIGMFYPLGHVPGTYLGLEVLKHFASWGMETFSAQNLYIFGTISPYQVFMYKFILYAKLISIF